MKIITGIAATTHIDKHNEKISKECLEDMANQIHTKYMPLDIEHKGIYIGVLLCAKVKQMKDGEWGLYFVAGTFENQEEKDFYPYQTPNTIWKQYIHLIDDNEDYSFFVELDKNNKDEFRQYLKNEKIDTQEYIQKSFDAPTIILIALSSLQTGIMVFDLIKKFKKEKTKTEIKIRITNQKKGISKTIKVDGNDDYDIGPILKEFLKK